MTDTSEAELHAHYALGKERDRYALWLADLGYTMEHRDLVPLHVQQFRAEANGRVCSAVGDTRDLDLRPPPPRHGPPPVTNLPADATIRRFMCSGR
jgi:hypothetical protein